MPDTNRRAEPVQTSVASSGNSRLLTAITATLASSTRRGESLSARGMSTTDEYGVPDEVGGKYQRGFDVRELPLVANEGRGGDVAGEREQRQEEGGAYAAEPQGALPARAGRARVVSGAAGAGRQVAVWFVRRLCHVALHTVTIIVEHPEPTLWELPCRRAIPSIPIRSFRAEPRNPKPWSSRHGANRREPCTQVDVSQKREQPWGNRFRFFGYAQNDTGATLRMTLVGEPVAGGANQGLGQVLYQVVGVFQAYGRAQQVLRRARVRPLDGCAVFYQALGAAQARGAREQPHAGGPRTWPLRGSPRPGKTPCRRSRPSAERRSRGRDVPEGPDSGPPPRAGGRSGTRPRARRFSECALMRRCSVRIPRSASQQSKADGTAP